MTEPGNQPALRRTRRAAIGVACAAAVAALWLAAAHWLFTGLQHHETFSELYFADPGQLPARMTAGTTWSVPFTIVNHEGRTMTYRYEIEVCDSVGCRVTGSGDLTAAADQPVSRSFTVAAPASGSAAKVVVHVINKGQSIHFYTQS